MASSPWEEAERAVVTLAQVERMLLDLLESVPSLSDEATRARKDLVRFLAVDEDLLRTLDRTSRGFAADWATGTRATENRLADANSALASLPERLERINAARDSLRTYLADVEGVLSPSDRSRLRRLREAHKV